MARKTETLTQEQATKLQHAHHGKEYYDELIHYMTRFARKTFLCSCYDRFYSSAPSELLVLVKEDANKSWYEIVGPEEPAKASETAPHR